MRKKELVRFIEKQGLKETQAYKDAVNDYMALLIEEDDVENIAPVFKIEYNIEGNNIQKE